MYCQDKATFAETGVLPGDSEDEIVAIFAINKDGKAIYEYAKDNALSNGSGKSFLWNAICYAFTGETISGLHSNLKNININEDT